MIRGAPGVGKGLQVSRGYRNFGIELTDPGLLVYDEVCRKYRTSSLSFVTGRRFQKKPKVGMGQVNQKFCGEKRSVFPLGFCRKDKSWRNIQCGYVSESEMTSAREEGSLGKRTWTVCPSSPATEVKTFPIRNYIWCTRRARIHLSDEMKRCRSSDSVDIREQTGENGQLSG